MNYYKTITKKLYNKYGKDTTKKYYKIKIHNLLFRKPSHIVATIKDIMLYEFVDEFLKRYYLIKESRKHIPKFIEFYQNYLTFFCKPTFRNLKLGKILLSAGEKKAHNFYNLNYGENTTKDNKNKCNSSIKNIFSDTIKESINGIQSFYDNSFNNNKSIQLEQSSFKLKKSFGDSENDSLMSLLNNLNATPSTSISNMNNNNNICCKKIINNKFKDKNRKKIINKILSQRTYSISYPFSIYNNQIKNNNKNEKEREKRKKNNSTSKKIENKNTRNNNNLVFNCKTDLNNKTLNLRNINNKCKLISPIKKLNYDNKFNKVPNSSLNHFQSNQIWNIFNTKRNKSNMNSENECSNNKNKTNKNLYQNLNKKKSLSNKKTSLNRLNKFTSRNPTLQNIMMTPFNKFDIQQKLLNKGKHHRLMISCNISSRNKTKYFSLNKKKNLTNQNVTLCNKIEKKNNRLYLKLSLNNNSKIE